MVMSVNSGTLLLHFFDLPHHDQVRLCARLVLIIIIIIRALQQPHEDEQKRSEVRII